VALSVDGSLDRQTQQLLVINQAEMARLYEKLSQTSVSMSREAEAALSKAPESWMKEQRINLVQKPKNLLGIREGPLLVTGIKIGLNPKLEAHEDTNLEQPSHDENMSVSSTFTEMYRFVSANVSSNDNTSGQRQQLRHHYE
jgi:hypothetical protein